MIKICDNDNQVVISFDRANEMSAFHRHYSENNKPCYVDWQNLRLHFPKLTMAEVDSWELQKDGPH